MGAGVMRSYDIETNPDDVRACGRPVHDAWKRIHKHMRPHSVAMQAGLGRRAGAASGQRAFTCSATCARRRG